MAIRVVIMAASYLSRFLAAMRSLETQMSALFIGLSDQASAELLRYADENGNIPIDSLFAIQESIGTMVTIRFLGRTSQSTRTPFVELPTGDILPLSPYSRILFDHADQVESIIIEQQRGIVARLAKNNPVIQGTDLFKPNPLAQFDKMHTWIDPNGYKLSDRIWRTAGTTRRKLDLFLDERIRQGQGALQMSRDLETFLKPGRTLRTKAPYGTDASYDAMRLARTEITRAHARAAERTALMNPFVEKMGIRLSGSHPAPDICDEAADAGPWPKDNIPMRYAIPLHPHCLCTYYYVMVEDKTAVLNQLLGVTA